MSDPILVVEHLRKTHHVRGTASGAIAVDDVSFSIGTGETLGLVGESGCGKTTLARTILQLTRADDGTVGFEGRDLRTLQHRELLAVRQRLQVILQDPYASLNPRLTVAQTLAEPLVTHHRIPPGRDHRRRREAAIGDLLTAVGLDPSVMDRYPHEFSGGQRQRIGIARALATDPTLVICDEPVSALDVSVQAQIVHLLGELQRARGLSYLFVSHDLAVIRQIADRVAVMYLGQLVEIAPTDELFEHPRHPYTQALLSAVPRVRTGATSRQRTVLRGEPPSPTHPPSGCRFRTRCAFAQPQCATARPPLAATSTPAHTVACFYPLEQPPSDEHAHLGTRMSHGVA